MGSRFLFAMEWTPALEQLRKALENLFSSEADARRVVARTGLDWGLIAADARLRNTWYSILEEAAKLDRLPRLIDAALDDYPTNPDLLLALRTYNASLASVSARGADYRAALQARRGAGAVLAHRGYQIDQDEVLRQWDLDRQLHEFEGKLLDAPRYGILSFAVLGDDWAVEDYMLPRLIEKLKEKRLNTVTKHQARIRIDQGRAELRMSAASVAHAGRDLAAVDILTLLAGDQKINRLVAVWNRDQNLKLREIVELVRDFLAAAEQHVRPTAEQNAVLIVLLWVSPRTGALARNPPFCCLPPIARVDAAFVRDWFEGRLRENAVDPEDVEKAARRLYDSALDNDGDPFFVHLAMKQIVEALGAGTL